MKWKKIIMLGVCKTKVKIKNVIDQNKGDMILWID